MKKEKIPECYLAGAKAIRDCISPKEFTDFLFQALGWLHSAAEKHKPKNEAHFTFLVIAEQIAIPFNSSSKDKIEQMAFGLAEVGSMDGDDGFTDVLGVFMIAYGFQLQEVNYDHNHVAKHLSGIQALQKIKAAIDQYAVSDLSKS